MNRKHFTMLIAVALVAGVVTTAGADVIAEFNFNDNDGVVDQKEPSATVTDFVDVGNLKTFGFDGTIDSYDDAGEAYIQTGGKGNNTGLLTFTISGLSIDPDEIYFNVASERDQGGRQVEFSLTATDNAGAETALTFDYWEPDTTGTLVDDDVPTRVIDGNDSGTIVADLSGLAASPSYTFTIQAYGSGSMDGYASLDNLTLTGVVPEPATMTLLGLGGLGVLIRRRRK